MLRDLGQHVLEVRPPVVVDAAAAQLAQHPVHHQVGIAADRRREVRVGVRGQAEVAEVHHVISRLLHRPQHEERHRALLRGAADAIGELLERTWMHGAACRRVEAMAERLQERLELQQPHRIGRFVHPVQRRHVGAFEVRGHRLVGQQHELLDDPVGDVALRGDDVGDGAILVDDHLGLGQVEVDRAATFAPAVQDREERTHPFERRHQPLVPRAQRLVVALEDGVHVVVGHARGAVDDAVVQRVTHHLAAAVHLHHAALHEAIDVRQQAAGARRQLVWEHVDGTLGEVHRGAACERLEIERAAFRHVVRHVGDVHRQAVVPVRQPIDGHGIVEIAGVHPVDGHDGVPTEIGASGDVVRLHHGVAGPGLGDGVGRVFVGNPVLPNHDLGVDAGGVDGAQYLHDAPGGLGRRAGPTGDLHADHLAIRGLERRVDRHAHVHVEPGVEGPHEDQPAAIARHQSDDLGAPPFLDRHHPSGDTAADAGWFDPHGDGVAMHGARASRRRHRHRRIDAGTDHHRRAVGPHLQSAGDVADRIDRGEPRALHEGQRAVVDQCAQLAAQGRLRFARDAQTARQFAGGGRGAGMFLQQAQQGVTVESGHGNRRRRRVQAYQAGSTRSSCRSPTLVPVGPSRSRSPMAPRHA